MPKSPLVAKMDAIQASLHPLLLARSFRKHGRTYNRSTENGLVQVVHFFMGPSDPPGTTPIRGLRASLYGLFTVELGIFLAEVGEAYIGMPKSHVNDYDCCLRARLGELSGDGDVWWKVSPELAVTAGVQRLLEARGFPFLDRLSSRDRILEQLRAPRQDRLYSASSPSRIVAAIILAARGDAESARRLLAAQCATTKIAGHREYVRGLAERLGLGSIPS